MQERKKELGYTNADIARLSGVPFGTVQKLFGGFTKAPRRATVEALQRILGVKPPSGELQKSLYPSGERDASTLTKDSFVRDASGVWQPLGTGYTVRDYGKVPENLRVELIDGQLFYMEAPTPLHQEIASAVFLELRSYVKENRGPCRVLMSPIDVQLDCDEQTMLQPDVAVFCRRDRIRRWGVYGSPDLVVEVLSPGTRKKDMFLKTYKYERAGVREYWIVDPEKKYVIVHYFNDQSIPAIYGFHAQIPVRIWNGECVIDMAAISEELQFYDELPDEAHPNTRQ